MSPRATVAGSATCQRYGGNEQRYEGEDAQPTRASEIAVFAEVKIIIGWRQHRALREFSRRVCAGSEGVKRKTADPTVTAFVYVQKVFAKCANAEAKWISRPNVGII